MSDNTRLLVAIAIWLLVAGGAGSYMSFVVGGHGSIVYLLFALPVAVFGALGSTLSIKVPTLRKARPWLRFLVVALVASAPVLILAFYGLLTKPRYEAADAITFLAMFAIPAVITAAATEPVSHRLTLPSKLVA